MFIKSEGFSSFPENLFVGVFFQNVFSPKAAGWTRPQAFKNPENPKSQKWKSQIMNYPSINN